jgi:hypothetical protein
VLLYEAGDLDGAEAAWRRCIERQHARASANLGFLLQGRGDLEGALAAHADAKRWSVAPGSRMATVGAQRSAKHTMAGTFTHTSRRWRRR